MADRFGATIEEWRSYMTLGLGPDLLPVVSRPDAPISLRSRMKVLGKTPSRYNQAREAVGIAKWTGHVASTDEIERWAREPDYGIAVQTRRLRAIDIDVDDPAAARSLMLALRPCFSDDPLVRVRVGSGKCLIPFWYVDGPLSKHVVPVAGGMVEILADGQQFVAAGLHPSGTRYEWIEGDIPVLDAEDFAALLATLPATGPIRIARRRKDLNGSTPLNLQDDVAEWLVDNWEVYDIAQDGRIYLACPFADEHSSNTGITSCAYFPAGTEGHAEGAFVCLHAHCAGRDQAEFLNATGFVASAFDDLEDEPDVAEPPSDDREARQVQLVEDRWPRLSRAKDGRIEGTMDNLLRALDSPAMAERWFALDRFKEELVWATLDRPLDEAAWRPFRDSDYARLQQRLEQRGFRPFAMQALRLAVLTVAEDHGIDSAQTWLSRLAWDGVPRLEAFPVRGWGWAETPYAHAVGRYVWTALAGRIIEPGCQADMTPALIGPQGARKTSAIKAMAPDPDFYLTIRLDAHDDDSARRLRGKLIAELEELRGLNTRSNEEIKAWLTRTHEEWIPKWREFATRFARRNLFFASGNEDEFLADPTGERRWLPGECGEIDVAWIIANRDQLWAEGAAMFRLDGVDWQDAEELARAQHDRFKISDAWEQFVRRWLDEEQLGGREAGAPATWAYLTTGDALTGAVGVPAGQIDLKRQAKMGKVLRTLGYGRTRVREGFEIINAFVRK